MDDHGELSPEAKQSAALAELLQELERRHPEEMRKEAAARGLPELALDLLLQRADSDDPTVREDARAQVFELQPGFLLPDAEPGVPDE
ncbi:MAG: hypothetical protein WCF12_15575 [Propionicimonas sp.]